MIRMERDGAVINHINVDNSTEKSSLLWKIKKEYLGKSIVTICGAFIILLTASIGIFLLFHRNGAQSDP